MAVSSALPGIRFVAEPPQPNETLPRMDVAGFVGLAAAGPVNLPVPIEDESRFREVFGPDLPLAWDAQAGELAHAYLGPAVRAFFRNGGRRCWVVRVAGADARSQVLPVPGLITLDSSGALGTALMQVRSPGSWGDRLRVGASLRREPLEAVGATATEIQLRVPQGGRLHAGDLIHAESPTSGTSGFLPLEHVQGPNTAGIFYCGLGPGIWLQEASEQPAIASLTLPDTEGSGVEVSVTADTEQGSPPTSADWSIFIQLPDAVSEPQPGMTLVAAGLANERILLAVDEVTETESSGSPPPRTLHLRGSKAWIELSGPTPDAATAERLSRVSLTLEVQRDAGERWTLEGLGFSDAHPRAAWKLPEDQSLYPFPDRDIPRQLSAQDQDLFAAVDHPRFPLAGLHVQRLVLPLAVLDPIEGGARTTPLGDTDPRTSLERDGLTEFRADLFLDPHIGARTHSSLPAEAFNWRYQQRTPLLGLHSLYFVSEITLLLLPDAVHPGWERDPSVDIRPEPPSALELRDPEHADDEAIAILGWTAIDPTDGYELQQADEPTFGEATTTVTALDTLAVSFAGRCPGLRWFRARRRLGGEWSPWSNTVAGYFPGAGFLPADRPIPEAPDLLPVDLQAGSRFQLQWAGVTDASDYELQEATTSGFDDARSLYSGPANVFTVLRALTQTLFFRVRALFDDEAGHWSETRVLIPVPLDAWRMQQLDTASLAGTRRLHQAMLEMAAARRDLLCLLALPREHREREMLAHKEALLSAFSADHPGPDYAALYHPWLMRSDGDGDSQLMPPDGAVCGIVAARALARGAWIAPANEPLTGILGLRPGLDDRVWGRAFGEQINLVRETARGILLLSAETLSRERDTVPINVRRLLILLRRLALREGNALVFEPNDASFRRRIQRRFEALMEYLFERGAFAGDDASKAYRVVTDQSVNTRQSVDQGRFIVELRVAPSRPLTFLTVRLVQSGSGGLEVEAN